MLYVSYITLHLFVGQFYGFCGSRTTQYPSNSVRVRLINAQPFLVIQVHSSAIPFIYHDSPKY
jgi:hypothetical protein